MKFPNPQRQQRHDTSQMQKN